jgi:hypothetical protein
MLKFVSIPQPPDIRRSELIMGHDQAEERSEMLPSLLLIVRKELPHPE